ncbi:hypothetical protein MKZ38_004458 [Zalerion maritima]|uniref:rRNA biogenesis protein RRP5 n=1 Tax=Zalerion maritima TaxID=339359 RepID=A0AAD5RXZ9_9PEZI|nr:hypothetical protein MKZ38_004458 [Zalerion maritima]
MHASLIDNVIQKLNAALTKPPATPQYFLFRRLAVPNMSGVKRKASAVSSAPSKVPKTNSSSSPAIKSKPHKTRDEGNTTAVKPSQTLNLREEEPLFPRGGGSALTPFEHKQIKAQATRDVLFEDAQKPAKVEKKKRRKSQAKGKDSTEKALKEDHVKIESLNHKRLVKGSLVLGQVSDIKPDGLVLSLPNNLIGHVSLSAISDPFYKLVESEANKENDVDDDQGAEEDDPIFSTLQAMFQIGQFLRACVLSTSEDSLLDRNKSKRRIELSIRSDSANTGLEPENVAPNVTLMASVLSVEDHGYIMDLGYESKLRGFLLKKEMGQQNGADLVPGAVFLCLVTSKTGGTVVQLSSRTEKFGKPRSTPTTAPTIDAFLPGTQAEVLITNVSNGGLIGKIAGSLDVTADAIHSGSAFGIGLSNKYEVGSKHKARVICTFPTADNPKVGISFLGHIISMDVPWTNSVAAGSAMAPLDKVPLSSIVEECTVRRVEPGIGLFVDIGQGLSGFVHISRLKDGKVDALYETSGPFKTDSTHKGRVLGYNPFDGLFQISFEQSVINQLYLRVEDVPIGELVQGVVARQLIREGGLAIIVKLADGIDGLVNYIHLSDVPLKHPERKFTEGTKVKARVLSKDRSSRRLRLTLKKTLVNSDDLPVQFYEQVTDGMKLNGTIVKFASSGAIIQFFGLLRGYLPNSEMSEAFVADPKSHFRIGQVLTLHVLEVVPEKRRLIVSCKDPAAFGIEKHSALKSLKIGELVSAKVIQTTENDIALELSDSGLRAVLPVGHLSDKSAKKNQSALKKIRADQALNSLMVLDKNEGRRLITLTQKPSLLEAAKSGNLLASFEDAKVGMVVPAVVRSITATGVFVAFAGGLSALLPKSYLPEDIRKLEQFGFGVSQSLSVQIKTVDTQTRRILATIPGQEVPSVVPSNPSESVPVVDAVDEDVSTISDISIGSVIKVRVSSVKSTQVNIRLSRDIQGRIDMSQVFDSWSEIPDPKHPLAHFKQKDIHTVKVLGVHDARNHKFLPFSHRSANQVLELSAKPSDVKNPSAAPLDLSSIETGSTWIAFVNGVSSICLWVTIAPNVRGRIDSLNLTDDVGKLNNLASSYPVGSAIRVRVLSVDLSNKHLDLTARSVDSPEDLTWNTVSSNSILPGRVISAKDKIVVRLSSDLVGFVDRVDMADDFDEVDAQKLQQNEMVRVSVISVDEHNKKIRLCMRPSKVLSSSLPVKDREITDLKQLSTGDVVRGFVRQISDKGLFVSLGSNIAGLVKIKDLSDTFLKEWKGSFKVGQLVRARVVYLNAGEGHAHLSLRPSILVENYKPPITYSDIQEGQIITGKIRKVEEFGAFIVIDKSANVSGLCHKSEMADSRVIDDARKFYNEGDAVKAVVLQVDPARKRISFGLKSSYFEDDSDEEMGESDDELTGEDVEMDDAGSDIVFKGTDTVDVAMGDSDEENEEDSDDDEGDLNDQNSDGGLEAGGFDWNAQMAASDEEGSGSDDPTDLLKQKKKRKSKAAAPAVVDADASGPQSAAEYDQAVIQSPDDSGLWMQYMAFQLENGELAKAREVIERAVASINPREQDSRLTVWTAYMNAELEYGTEESLQDVFARACRDSDERKVHESLIHIYIGTERHDAADELFKKLLKKFGSFTPEVWINYSQFLHTTMLDPSSARDLLPRAIQRLGQGSMVQLTSRFAAIEYRSPKGLAERGYTLFEGILTSFPKRMDIWNQFVDLEINAKGGDKNAPVVRRIFEQGSQVKGLKAHAAKKWFKKWAGWEESKGDGAEGKAKVMKKAAEWVKAAEGRKKARADAEEED